ncbi:hypothetical protein [Dyadobacter pollutisoli]|uniref:Uncharacterized protein n=1 Tax=Dyadobacter pollutisoli TaxID=2910158 RepID=A0A9E8ND75_9BACT|nr:hypothetical protein [Dyadobacter pollutisoli]WAC12341.1 hypothetical protein ON006_32030 [Dyadobacter pollutisoli]
MKIIFWLAVTIEGGTFFHYLRKTMNLYLKDQHVYPEQYGKIIVPAVVMGILFFGSLLIKYGIGSDKYATWFALIPAIVMVLAFIAMIFATIFLGGKGH